MSCIFPRRATHARAPPFTYNNVAQNIIRCACYTRFCGALLRNHWLYYTLCDVIHRPSCIPIILLLYYVIYIYIHMYMRSIGSWVTFGIVQRTFVYNNIILLHGTRSQRDVIYIGTCSDAFARRVWPTTSKYNMI